MVSEENIFEDANAGLCASMKGGTGTVDRFRCEMKADVKNLETKMTDVFKNERTQRKKDYDDLEANMRRRFENKATKMDAGFLNEENETRKFFDQLTKMKEEVETTKTATSCAVSSAARTRFGLGSGTFARPPPTGPKWKEAWEPRKI